MTPDIKKVNWIFYVNTKVDTCQKFLLSRLIFIFINCYQLSSAVGSCWQLMTADIKNVTGILMYTLKLICDTWFSFTSVGNSCYQLLTADDSCKRKNVSVIFIYPLNVIFVQNLRSVGCSCAWLESVTAHGSQLPVPGSRQAKLLLLRLSWAGACAWVEQFPWLIFKRCIEFFVSVQICHIS